MGVSALCTLLVACSVAASSGKPKSNKIFHPDLSTTFFSVDEGRVGASINISFLDGTNFVGTDAVDYIDLGGLKVKTRFCLIRHIKSHDFAESDGIIGFGASDRKRTAAILKTISQSSRPSWDLVQDKNFTPVPEIFSFTADEKNGELQLGGWDPASVTGDIKFTPITAPQYGVNLTSITFDGTELLRFTSDAPNDEKSKEQKGFSQSSVHSIFDSGTTCTLLPNTTLGGVLMEAPFSILQRLYAEGRRASLIFTINGMQFEVDGCVDPFSERFIMGDPWFRRYVIVHDVRNWENRQMGLGLRNPNYVLGTSKVVKTVLSERMERPTVGHPLQLVREIPLTKSRLTYNIPVGVGTPEQRFRLIFDTGSFLLAVFSKPPNASDPILDFDLQEKVAVSQQGLLTSIVYSRHAWVAPLLAINGLLLIIIGTIHHLRSSGRAARNNRAQVELPVYGAFSYQALQATPNIEQENSVLKMYWM